jgi:hypothetical protein
MNASIALLRKVCCVLVACFVVTVSICRANLNAVRLERPTPPALPKQKVTECPPTAAVQKQTIEVRCLSPFYIDGEHFQIKITFTDPADYKAFASAYLCLTPDKRDDGKKTQKKTHWEYINKKPLPGNDKAYVLFVRAHWPLKDVVAEKGKDGGGRGTGTGRVIVTSDRGGMKVEYYPKNDLKLESLY